MAVIVTQTTWFKEWLRGFIVRQAEDYVNGRLSIGRLDGNLFFGVELEDVDVTMNGKTVVDIKDVGLDYNVFTFSAATSCSTTSASTSRCSGSSGRPTAGTSRS